MHKFLPVLVVSAAAIVASAMPAQAATHAKKKTPICYVQASGRFTPVPCPPGVKPGTIVHAPECVNPRDGLVTTC